METTAHESPESRGSRPLRLLWWVAALALTAGVYIWLDRTAWADGLPEAAQTAVRLICGVAVFSLAAAGDPGRRRAPSRES